MAHRWSARASWLTGNSRHLSSTLGSAVAKEALFGSGGTSGGDGDEEELNGDLHDELVVAVMMMIQTSNSGGGDADECAGRVELVRCITFTSRRVLRSGVFEKREKGQKVQIISDGVHTRYVGILIFLSLNLSVYYTCNQQLLCQHLSLDQEPPTTSTSDVTARTTTWRLLIMQ